METELWYFHLQLGASHCWLGAAPLSRHNSRDSDVPKIYSTLVSQVGVQFILSVAIQPRKNHYWFKVNFMCVYFFKVVWLAGSSDRNVEFEKGSDCLVGILILSENSIKNPRFVPLFSVRIVHHWNVYGETVIKVWILDRGGWRVTMPCSFLSRRDFSMAWHRLSRLVMMRDMRMEEAVNVVRLIVSRSGRELVLQLFRYKKRRLWCTASRVNNSMPVSLFPGEPPINWEVVCLQSPAA